MEVFRGFLFIVGVLVGVASAASTYHACPNQSVCVAADYCPPNKTVYNAMKRADGEKFLCGTLEGCTGYVCCSEPSGLARGFSPSSLFWFFPFNLIHSYISSILPTPDYSGDQEDDSFCPDTTACVPAEMCNVTHINEKGNYTKCGATMKGWVCCNAEFTEDHLSDSLSFLENVLTDLAKGDQNDANKPMGDTSGQRRKRSTGPVIKPARPPHVVLINKEKLKPKMGRSASQEEASWECGVTLDYSRQLTRIYAVVGNHEALEGDFPWHVAITDDDNKYLCSGVIVEEKVVVTVAHCVFQRSAKTLLVRLGDIDLQENSERFVSKDAVVNSVIIHPQYDDHDLENDIAILKLEVSLRGLPNVRPACLPDKLNPDIGKCKVPGWGSFVQSTQDLIEFSYQLRSANFHIVPRRECQDSLRKVAQIGSFFRLQKTSLCARGYTSADTCKGDGGSGLVCLLNTVYVLKGLVSWGAGCGQNLPGVYTDIAQFIDFIRNFESEKYIPDKPKRQQETYSSNLDPNDELNEIYITSNGNIDGSYNLDEETGTKSEIIYDDGYTNQYDAGGQGSSSYHPQQDDDGYGDKNNPDTILQPDFYESLNEKGDYATVSEHGDYNDHDDQDYYESISDRPDYYKPVDIHYTEDQSSKGEYNGPNSESNYNGEQRPDGDEKYGQSEYYEYLIPDYYEDSALKENYNEDASSKDSYNEGPADDYYEDLHTYDKYEDSTSQYGDNYGNSPYGDDYFDHQPTADDLHGKLPPNDDYNNLPQTNDNYQQPSNRYDYYDELHKTEGYYDQLPALGNGYDKPPLANGYTGDAYDKEDPVNEYYGDQPHKNDYYGDPPHINDYYEDQPYKNDYHEGAFDPDLFSDDISTDSDYFNQQTGYHGKPHPDSQSDQYHQHEYDQFPVLYRPVLKDDRMSEVYHKDNAQSGSLPGKLLMPDRASSSGAGSKYFHKQSRGQTPPHKPYFMSRNSTKSNSKKAKGSPLAGLVN